MEINKKIYKVIIKDINFKLCRNRAPFIELVTETLDNDKMTLTSNYFFTNKSKFFVYNDLVSILNKYNIEVDEEDIMKSLNLLIGKEAYIVKVLNYDKRYEFYKDYEEISNN